MVHDASKFVFFGTPRFAVIVLDELKAAGLVPSLIVTAPDKPAGRGMRLTPPPVKIWAQENKVTYMQPERLSDATYHLKPNTYALGVLAAYGKIIPRSLVEALPRGILNVHPSLLPKYRGSSPIQSQILADDRDVGVSIMLLDEKMDHGPIVTNTRYKIQDTKYKIPCNCIAG